MTESKIRPPAERPPMPKGTLLRVARKAVVYGRPITDDLGKIAKGETVMSLGEFASSGRHTVIKVVCSLGPGWLRMKDVHSFDGNVAGKGFVVLTLDEAKALKAAFMGDSFETKDIDSAIDKIDAIEESLSKGAHNE